MVFFLLRITVLLTVCVTVLAVTLLLPANVHLCSALYKVSFSVLTLLHWCQECHVAYKNSMCLLFPNVLFWNKQNTITEEKPPNLGSPENGH